MSPELTLVLFIEFLVAIVVMLVRHRRWIKRETLVIRVARAAAEDHGRTILMHPDDLRVLKKHCEGWHFKIVGEEHPLLRLDIREEALVEKGTVTTMARGEP